MTANLVEFALFLFAMAAIMAVMTWRMWKVDKENVRLSSASATWPTVQGLVSSAFVARTSTDDETSRYEPRVIYTHTVAGRAYSGARIAFTRMQFASKKRADAVVANFLVGATVPVAYDPADPQNSVLDRATKPPSVSFWTAFVGVMTIIIAVLGVGMFFISF